MQDNVITLAIDTANTGSTTDVDFTRNEELTNRSTYVQKDTHTLAHRYQVQFYRTYPKRSGASLGSRKYAVKITQDFDVPNADGSGSITLPAIVDCQFSLPVGMTVAQSLLMRQGMVALLDRDDIMTDLDVILEI
jgi:hypothetical protein